MTSLLNNEIRFNVLCHTMAKDNLSLAYEYIIDIFNNSMSYKVRGTKAVKASLLTVRSFLLCIPFVNRITQFALRILSPELRTESFPDFGEEELEIRYSAEALLSYCSQDSQNKDALISIFASFEGLEEFQEALQNPDGSFVEFNQEEREQMLQLYSIFLKNPEEFQNILQRNSLQGVSQEEDFPTLINTDPNAFKQLVQGQENGFGPLSEEEQSNLDNWVKEMQLDKDVEDRATDITQIQDGLNKLD